MNNWQNKIRAFLHDPPDKALILFREAHEKKRDELLQKLNLTYDKNIDIADHIAAAMQRLNIPEDYRMDTKSKPHIGFRECRMCMFWPEFRHTLSGVIEKEKYEEINKFIASYGYDKFLEKYGFKSDYLPYISSSQKINWKSVYFLLWRLLPEKYPLGYILPADTRIPDHSIWDHLDVTAAISSCLGDEAPVLFALKILGVQEFISHSRKLSDLWASSHIFSLLLFEAAKKIVDELGPDVVVYPQLRGNPLLDHYLESQGMEIAYDKEKIRIASLPNTLLCFIPSSKARDGENEKCEKAIRDKWMKISEKVRNYLKNANIKPDENLWNSQIKKSFSTAVAYREFFKIDSYEGVKKDLPMDIRETQDRWLNFVEKLESNYGHFYLPTYALLGTILTQSSRLWDAWEEDSETEKQKPKPGKKCLMCGLRSALVERKEADGYSYWDGSKWENVEEGKIRDKWKNILKEGERLCAVCLVKRIYRYVFSEEFNVDPPKFESVAEIAGREFIEKIENTNEFEKIEEEDIELIYENEWASKDKAKLIEKLGGKNGEIYKKLEEWWTQYGKPNKYYAILMMDGDRIGKMLFGETLPNFGNFLHSAFERKIGEWEKGEDLIKMKRILSPSIHMAISRALKDFSIYKVPEIVEKKYYGFLVYSGGDDVLALFPTNKVLDAAKELQEFFKKDFYEIEVSGERRKVMGLGKYASMSAGIVFAHYKYPLYDVIEKVREAEKNAKNEYGRNAFCMSFIKRSGELLSAGGKWDFIEDILSIVEAILSEKISHRFIYDLWETTKFLDGEMLKAETKRLLQRRKSEKTTDEEINNICGKILCLVEKYNSCDLSVEEIGKILKILSDAYRGEE